MVLVYNSNIAYIQFNSCNTIAPLIGILFLFYCTALAVLLGNNPSFQEPNLEQANALHLDNIIKLTATI